METSVFLTSLRNFEIDEPLGTGLQVSPGLLLTNDFRKITGFLSSAFRNNIGQIEYDDLAKSKGLLYTAGRADTLKSDSAIHGALIAFLSICRNFTHSLWMVKDSAVNIELGFAKSFLDGEEMTQSNFFSFRNTNAHGLEPTLKFSRHELRQATAFANNFLGPLTSEKGIPLEDILERLKSPKIGSQQSLSRLTRAIYFLSSARATSDLGIKIVHYCTVLETLFSTETTELSHKISQRVALFLGKSPEEKLELFASVKKIYGLRSKVVHGGAIGKTGVESAPFYSEKADDILRRLFVKIESSLELQKLFKSDVDVLDQFFLRSALGCPVEEDVI